MARPATKPPPPPPSTQPTWVVPGVATGAAAQVGVPAAAAIAAALASAAVTKAGVAGAVSAGTEAIERALRNLAALRLLRIKTSLVTAGIPPSALAKVLSKDLVLEREFRRRSTERVEAGLRLALATDDPSARAAAVRSVLDRESLFARQRGDAQLSRVVGGLERDAIRETSPEGAYWELGPAERHCSVCPLLAGKVWPWGVLDELLIPLHYGCKCRLRSYGDAIASGFLVDPKQVVPPAQAAAVAKSIIAAARALPGYGIQEEEAILELTARERILELGGDADFLAASPLSVDFGLREAEAQTGAMVALYPPPEIATKLALDGGEEPKDLHLTLAFLGEAGGPKSHAAAIAAVRRWAASCPPLEGEVSGPGRFVSGPKPVTYLSLDLPALPAERERLVTALDRAGVPPSRDHGFTPHLTLDYANRRPKIDRGIPISFDRVTLAWGDEHSSFPLGGKAGEALREAQVERHVSGYVRADGTFVHSYTGLWDALDALRNPSDPTTSVTLPDSTTIRAVDRQIPQVGRVFQHFEISKPGASTETARLHHDVAAKAGVVDEVTPERALAHAMEDLPAPGSKRALDQPGETFDEFTAKGIEANNDFAKLTDRKDGIGPEIGADAHYAGDNFEDHAAVVEAVAEHPDEPHVILVPPKGSGGPKKEARLREKVAGYADGHKSLTDFVRGAITVPSTAEVGDVVERLKARGAEVEIVDAENKFFHDPSDPHATGPQGQYRDASLVVRMPNGVMAELQILPNEIYLAKERAGFYDVPDAPPPPEGEPGWSGHLAYEQVRAIEGGAKGRELTGDEVRRLAEFRRIQDWIFQRAWKKLGHAPTPTGGPSAPPAFRRRPGSPPSPSRTIR